LFAIFGNSGTVLVYSGTDPTDWVQIGAWKMPAPISNMAFVEVDGDIFVATEKYAYWVRDLLVGGAVYAYDNSPSQPIQNLWQSVGYSSSVSNALVSHAFYLDKVDDIPIEAIVVQCSNQNTTAAELTKVSGASDACCFVYFKKYKAWAIWFLTFPAPILKIADIFYTTGSATTATVFDVEYLNSTGIQPTWSTPYFSTFPGKSQTLVGVRPFFQSTKTPAEITIGGLADYSDFRSPFSFQAKSSAVSPVTPGLLSQTVLSLPVNTYQQYRPLAPIAMQGGEISIYSRFTELSANPLSTQIYKMIAYLEDGGDLQ
jgi:hypothetical protein